MWKTTGLKILPEIKHTTAALEIRNYIRRFSKWPTEVKKALHTEKYNLFLNNLYLSMPFICDEFRYLYLPFGILNDFYFFYFFFFLLLFGVYNFSSSQFFFMHKLSSFLVKNLYMNMK